MKERFSKRIGLQPVATEITIRYDAPEEFRNIWLAIKNITM